MPNGIRINFCWSKSVCCASELIDPIVGSYSWPVFSKTNFFFISHTSNEVWFVSLESRSLLIVHVMFIKIKMFALNCCFPWSSYGIISFDARIFLFLYSIMQTFQQKFCICNRFGQNETKNKKITGLSMLFMVH